MESRHSIVLGFEWETQFEPFTGGSEQPLSHLHLLRSHDKGTITPLLTPSYFFTWTQLCHLAGKLFVPWKSRCVWWALKQGDEMHWGRCKGVTFGKLRTDLEHMSLTSCRRGVCQHLSSLSTTFSPPFHPMNQSILALPVKKSWFLN